MAVCTQHSDNFTCRMGHLGHSFHSGVAKGKVKAFPLFLHILHVMCYDKYILRRGGPKLIIKLHPLAKTAIEARRAINRLEVFMEVHPEDEHVKSGAVSVIIENLKEVRSHIPAPLRDVDLEK